MGGNKLVLVPLILIGFVCSVVRRWYRRAHDTFLRMRVLWDEWKP